MKHKVLLSLCICALIGILAACGGGDDAPVATAPAASAPATTAPATTAPATATTAPAAATAAPTAAPTAEPVATTAPAPAQPSGDARAEILAAYQKMFEHSYRTEGIIQSDDGDITLAGEFAPPDRLHSTTTASSFSAEVIIVGDSGWRRIDGEEWVALPPGVAAQSLDAQKLAEDMMTNAEALGDDTLDGRNVWVYRYGSNLGDGFISTTTLYVDADTGLPVQQLIEGEAAGVKSTTVQKIVYDDAVVIEAPG